jgi:hypothetical protein
MLGNNTQSLAAGGTHPLRTHRVVYDVWHAAMRLHLKEHGNVMQSLTACHAMRDTSPPDALCDVSFGTQLNNCIWRRMTAVRKFWQCAVSQTPRKFRQRAMLSTSSTSSPCISFFSILSLSLPPSWSASQRRPVVCAIASDQYISHCTPRARKHTGRHTWSHTSLALAPSHDLRPVPACNATHRG